MAKQNPHRKDVIRPAEGVKLTDKQKEVNKLLGGPQTHTLIFGGGRSGKTVLLVRALVIRALRASGSRHFIFRQRFNAVVNSIGGDSGTLPTVLKLFFPGLKVDVDRTRWIYTFPNGSEIWLLGLDDKERTEKILGLEAASLYFNEASQIKYPAVKMARSRLVQKAKIDGTDEYLKLRTFTDLNPSGKSHWTYRAWIENIEPDSDDLPLPNPQAYAWATMNPGDNRENLAADALDELMALPEAERARFFEGRYVDEIDNAIFKQSWISQHRVADTPDLARVVVSFDPAGSALGDETGIIVLGRENNDYYVIKDLSAKLDPTEASKIAIKAYDDYMADSIVWEKNFGGKWIESSLHATARDMRSRGERDSEHVATTSVVARRGKTLRSEPVAHLYELGRVHHLGEFRQLEDQMVSFTPDWNREEDGSPDRVDALTQGITHLTESAPSSRSVGFGKYAKKKAA
jgi:hypothetical protein